MVQALEEGLKAEVGLPALDQPAGTINGVGIDTKDYDEALIVLNVGDATSGTADVKVQESDVLGSGYTDVTGAAFTQIDSSNDLTMYVGRIRVKNFKKFIRLVSVVATNNIDISASILLGKFDGLAPVTQLNTPEFALDYVSDGGTASV